MGVAVGLSLQGSDGERFTEKSSGPYFYDIDKIWKISAKGICLVEQCNDHDCTRSTYKL